MSDPTKVHVHTSDDGPCGYCSGDDCPMRYCPGCHGAGTEPSGTTHAGLAEQLACDECGPDCPQDCGCRVDDAAEHHEFVALCHPGATQSPDGSPSATEGLRGPEGAVTDAEAAEWARLADAATEGPWVVDQDGSIGAPMAGLVCGEDGHPRPDCSECGTRVCHINVMPGEPDAAFIVAARTAVPRLLAEREALTTDLAEARATISRLNARAQVAEAAIAELTGTGKGKGRKVAREVWTRCEESHGQACRTTGQARAWAVALEAENARLREGIERLVSDLDNPLRERDSAAPQDMPEVAEDLRALLADTDSAREDDGGE